MHWIAGQSEHTSLLRTMSFVKIGAFQTGGATIMYSMRKIMCFLTLNCINIALHQINKILFFLAMSYDPFKTDMEIVNISWASLMTALSPARKQWLRTHTYTCSHIHTHLEYFDWMSRTLCCCMYLCVNMQACMCVTFNVLLKVGYVIFQNALENRVGAEYQNKLVANQQ